MIIFDISKGNGKRNCSDIQNALLVASVLLQIFSIKFIPVVAKCAGFVWGRIYVLHSNQYGCVSDLHWKQD